MQHTCNDNVQKDLKKRNKKGENVKPTNSMPQSTAQEKYDQNIKNKLSNYCPEACW